jgi:hypothetical protein
MCVVCYCRRICSEDEIRLHLYSNGFKPNYRIFDTSNSQCVGDEENHVVGSSSSIRHVQFEMMDSMIVNALGVNAGLDAEYDYLLTGGFLFSNIGEISALLANSKSIGLLADLEGYWRILYSVRSLLIYFSANNTLTCAAV